MSGLASIPKGTKLKMAMDVFNENGSPEYNLMTTFFEAVDDATFLVSVPMVGGKPLEFDDTQKYNIILQIADKEYTLSCYADFTEKKGIRTYWKMRRVTELREMFRRADERFKVNLTVEYTSDDWKLNPDGSTEYREGMTLDISAGGAAVNLTQQFKVGEMCTIRFPKIGTSNEGNLSYEVLAAVCWIREAQKGSAFRNVCGVQFRFGDSSEREKMADYIEAIRKKYKI